MNEIWPSGDNKDVLSIKTTCTEFFALHNIEFQHFTNDVGGYNAALISIPDIGNVVMREYDDTPIKGVIFMVDGLVPSLIAVKVIKNFFTLTDDDIAWITPVD